MLKKVLAVSFGILLLAGCAPKIRTNISQKYPPLNFQEEVWTIPQAITPPVGAEVLGTVRVGDAGMTTNCTYSVVLERAKEEARKSGGNAIHVTEHKTPDFMSSCHRITAEVLRLSQDQISMFRQNETESDSLIDHAVLYVYRTRGPGALVSYNINLGDSVICRVTNKFRQKIEIRNEGAYELWAKTESKASVPVNFKIGRTYYLRCGVGMGLLVGRPTLDIVDPATGKQEFFGKRK
ncbi:hypothetical protein [Dyadobacter pollutisoli]|jgi:hypothetical protein|uniref:Lipoprotein n=1 Tax=Dyadobacter pollutisoli TaxID=2910158 RepID=A0A9E8SJJ6_9BACT|nr:hypothetical protein [Dyadobacter pollutisoli]WAC11430.1 hypothetical protein ON006_27315 [Dyadobacter pollutisoli]